MSKNFISIKEAAQEEKRRKELDHFNERLSKQEKLSWNIVIGVVIAFIFIIGSTAIEIIIFHTRDNKGYLDLQNQYFQEVKELQKNTFDTELRLQKEIDDLHAKETIQKDSKK